MMVSQKMLPQNWGKILRNGKKRVRSIIYNQIPIDENRVKISPVDHEIIGLREIIKKHWQNI